MMTKKLIVATSVALMAAAANADDMKQALSASDEAAFLKVAGPEWTTVGEGQFEKIDATGKQVRVAFGAAALENDLAELTHGLEANQKQLKTETDKVKIAALKASINSYERALGALQSAQSSEKAVYGSGTLRGCSVDVALNATFDASIAMVDYGYSKIEAETQEFGPYGPGAGQVTLVATVDGYTDTASAFMGGLSYLSADLWGPPNWGCSMEARASIVPACSVTGYRSVRWTASCDSVSANLKPTRLYSNYRFGSGGVEK